MVFNYCGIIKNYFKIFLYLRIFIWRTCSRNIKYLLPNKVINIYNYLIFYIKNILIINTQLEVNLKKIFVSKSKVQKKKFV